MEYKMKTGYKAFKLKNGKLYEAPPYRKIFSSKDFLF